MKKPITPDVADAIIVSIASAIMISVFLAFAVHLFSAASPESNHFSTSNFAQVFRSPF